MIILCTYIKYLKLYVMGVIVIIYYLLLFSLLLITMILYNIYTNVGELPENWVNVTAAQDTEASQSLQAAHPMIFWREHNIAISCDCIIADSCCLFASAGKKRIGTL